MNWKNKYLLEKLLPKKNKIILIFIMLHFLNKIKKNVWRYYYLTPVYQKYWWYDLQFLRYRASQTENDNFRSSFALLLPKKSQNTKFWNNEKHCWIYHYFPHVYRKSQLYDVCVLRYGVRQVKSFLILGHFFHLLPPEWSRKFKIRKKWEKRLEILSFYTYVP